MGVLSHLIKIGFPNNCVTCSNSLLRNEKFICSNCFFYIPKGDSSISKTNEVSTLLGQNDSVLGGGHLFNFDKDGKTQELLHELKYKSNLQLGLFLGELLGLEFQTELNELDCIIPVPLHKKKLHQRGYNQSEIISKGIQKVLNKSISTSHLIRIRYTETQTKKNRTERQQNIKNAFEVINPQELEAQTVLLIDDVITTGATLKECIECLKQEVKGIKIIVLVLARAVY